LLLREILADKRFDPPSRFKAGFVVDHDSKECRGSSAYAAGVVDSLDGAGTPLHGLRHSCVTPSPDWVPGAALVSADDAVSPSSRSMRDGEESTPPPTWRPAMCGAATYSHSFSFRGSPCLCSLACPCRISWPDQPPSPNIGGKRPNTFRQQLQWRGETDIIFGRAPRHLRLVKLTWSRLLFCTPL